MSENRNPPPSDLADKFMLRLPDGMRDKIAEEAQKNNRSMNAEIVARIRFSFFPPNQFGQHGDIGRASLTTDQLIKRLNYIGERLDVIERRLDSAGMADPEQDVIDRQKREFEQEYARNQERDRER